MNVGGTHSVRMMTLMGPRTGPRFNRF